MCLNCWTSGKQSRPRSDVAVCSDCSSLYAWFFRENMVKEICWEETLTSYIRITRTVGSNHGPRVRVNLFFTVRTGLIIRGIKLRLISHHWRGQIILRNWQNLIGINCDLQRNLNSKNSKGHSNKLLFIQVYMWEVILSHLVLRSV